MKNKHQYGYLAGKQQLGTPLYRGFAPACFPNAAEALLRNKAHAVDRSPLSCLSHKSLDSNARGF